MCVNSSAVDSGGKVEYYSSSTCISAHRASSSSNASGKTSLTSNRTAVLLLLVVAVLVSDALVPSSDSRKTCPPWLAGMTIHVSIALLRTAAAKHCIQNCSCGVYLISACCAARSWNEGNGHSTPVLIAGDRVSFIPAGDEGTHATKIPELVACIPSLRIFLKLESPPAMCITELAVCSSMAAVKRRRFLDDFFIAVAGGDMNTRGDCVTHRFFKPCVEFLLQFSSLRLRRWVCVGKWQASEVSK